MGEIHCPKIKEIKDSFVIYNSKVYTFSNLYDDVEDEFYNTLFSQNMQNDFGNFLLHFIPYDGVAVQDGVFYIIDINNNNKIMGQINKNNIDLFMKVIKVMHCLDSENEDDDEHLKILSTDSEQMKEFKLRTIKARKEYKKKIRNMQSGEDGIGIFEILSSVSARHPSINPINIGELNYFQLIEQFKRLNMVDSFNINMGAAASGNLQKEEIGKIKHYTSKTSN